MTPLYDAAREFVDFNAVYDEAYHHGWIAGALSMLAAIVLTIVLVAIL